MTRAIKTKSLSVNATCVSSAGKEGKTKIGRILFFGVFDPLCYLSHLVSPLFTYLSMVLLYLPVSGISCIFFLVLLILPSYCFLFRFHNFVLSFLFPSFSCPFPDLSLPGRATQTLLPEWISFIPNVFFPLFTSFRLCAKAIPSFFLFSFFPWPVLQKPSSPNEFISLRIRVFLSSSHFLPRIVFLPPHLKPRDQYKRSSSKPVSPSFGWPPPLLH